MTYWYLDCICGMRLQLHEASQRSAHTQMLAAQEAAPKKANKKKAKPTKPPSAGGAATRAELQMVVVRRDLCRALALLIAALRQECAQLHAAAAALREALPGLPLPAPADAAAM